MKELAWVLCALVVASVYEKVHCQDDPCNGGSWAQSTYSAIEGGSTVIIAELQSTFDNFVFLSWTIVSDSATAGADFVVGGGVLVFEPGSTQQSINVSTTQDLLLEGTEMFFVILTDLTETIQCDQTTVQIIDDESLPPDDVAIVWEQTKYNLDESIDFNDIEVCAVPAPNITLTSDVTISVNIQPITADFGMDYASQLTEELTLRQSDQRPRVCIILFIINDQVPEDTEVIRASFDQQIGGAIVTQVTEICIIDDEQASTTVWEFDEYQFQEGENATNEICAVVVNSTVSFLEVRQVIFRNGSATANVDYFNPGELQLVFSPGDTRQCVQIDILDDSVLEVDEDFFVDLVLGEDVSTTRVVIEDDDGEIILNVEREIYTVTEGNELEVCVVINDGTPAPFAFHVTGFLYIPNLNLFIPIYFAIGDIRSCGTVLIPGNTYVDKQEREKQISFEVEDSEFSGFVEFDRESAWCFIADDDIAQVGFAEAQFIAFEDSGSVSVCLELCEGTTNRPIDVLLYTSDGTAMNGINYEEFFGIVTIPALGVTGDIVCTDITILDDGEVTPVLNFSLSVFIADTHIIIPDGKASAVVEIQPAFEICFDMDTPRVNGTELFVSFDSTVPVDSATCSVDTLPPQDCTNGSATFEFMDLSRTQPYDIMIEATFGSETRTLTNNVRSETTGLCDTHLVNKGVIFDGSNATIYVQPTGPSPGARVTDLECRCFPAETSFSPCPSPSGTGSFALHFEYVIPDGCTRIAVRQTPPGTCSPRRALQITGF